MSMTKTFITKLGGPTLVAESLDAGRETSTQITRQRIGAWYKAGIPHIWRAKLAMMAIDKGVGDEFIPEGVMVFVNLWRDKV